jgi:hypothetical protein
MQRMKLCKNEKLRTISECRKMIFHEANSTAHVTYEYHRKQNIVKDLQ